MEFSQYVGLHDSRAWPFEETTFTPVPQSPAPFSVTLDSNGLFESLTLPPAASGNPLMGNIMRGWASALQINSAQIAKGNVGFRSQEQLLNGKCDVTYTVTDSAVRKSVSHYDDCENPVYRLVDDYRGMRCDGKKFNYPASLASTVFLVEKKGSNFQVNAIISTGSLIAQLFEEAGASQFVYTNSTSKLVNRAGFSVADIPSIHQGMLLPDKKYSFALFTI